MKRMMSLLVLGAVIGVHAQEIQNIIPVIAECPNFTGEVVDGIINKTGQDILVSLAGNVVEVCPKCVGQLCDVAGQQEFCYLTHEQQTLIIKAGVECPIMYTQGDKITIFAVDPTNTSTIKPVTKPLIIPDASGIITITKGAGDALTTQTAALPTKPARRQAENTILNNTAQTLLFTVHYVASEKGANVVTDLGSQKFKIAKGKVRPFSLTPSRRLLKGLKNAKNLDFHISVIDVQIANNIETLQTAGATIENAEGHWAINEKDGKLKT